MNNQQFDEHIKEQFSNFSPEVSPHIWENIIAERERRKPVGFWYTLLGNKNKLLLLGMLLAIITGGALLYIYTNSFQPNSQLVINKDQTKTDSNKDLAGNNSNSDLQENPAVANEKNTPGEKGKVQDSNSGLSSPGSVKAGIYAPALQTGNEESPVTNAFSENTKYPAGKKRNKGSGGFLNINTENPGLDENDEYTTGGSLLGRLTFDAQKISAKKRSKNDLLLSFGPINYLPDCPTIEKNASGNKKYLELYAGPDYAFRSLSDTGNSEYLKRRKESTKFSSAYSAGIRYTKVFNNSMSVRGGLNYSQINEKFTFSQGNLVQITYIINANGDTIGSYTTTGTRYKTTINKYRSIDVPLVVGYEMGNGKFHANINAGIVVNIYSWQKGDVLDTAYQPVSITTGKNSSPYQFKTNAGVGFIGGVSVYYKLNDRIHLMAEPYFRYNFSPMNNENLTLKQKYQTAGLRVGIRFDLK